MNLAPAPDKYLREVVQEILNEILREDTRSLKRDVNETHNGSFTVSGMLNVVGGGVDFPTTQVPSSNPNVLDDYEEGTFTPTLTFGGAAVGLTYTTQVGTYTKIGDRVFSQIYIQVNDNGSSSGAAAINGLPFTATNVANTHTSAAMYGEALASITGHLQGYVTPNTTTITPSFLGTGAPTILTETHIPNGAILFASGHYIAA